MINDGSVDGVLVFSSNSNDCLAKKLKNMNTVPTVFLEEEQSDFVTEDLKQLAEMYFNELLSKTL